MRKISMEAAVFEFFRSNSEIAPGILREACMITERPFILRGASNSSRKSSANAPSLCKTASTIFAGPSPGATMQAPAPRQKGLLHWPWEDRAPEYSPLQVGARQSKQVPGSGARRTQKTLSTSQRPRQSSQHDRDIPSRRRQP